MTWKRCGTVDGRDYSKYEVSTDGFLRDWKTKTMKSDKPDAWGYVVNGLLRKRCQHTRRHRLVLQTFKPNPAPNLYTDVDHIDGCRTNNKLSNLRWVNRTLNLMNKKLSRGTRRTSSGKYSSQLMVHTKQKYLGTYYTEPEAHEVYLAAKAKAFKNESLRLKFLSRIQRLKILVATHLII